MATVTPVGKQMPPDKIEQIRNYKITKGNYLIQKSRYNFTLQEQRIINFIIAHIRPEDTDIYKYFEFNLVTFCKVCGIESTNTTHLRRVIKKLYDRPSVEVFDGEKYVPYKWLGDYEIIPKKRIIRVQLHHRLGQFLMDLKRNFTSSELCLCLLFNNTYTFHLYELFKSLLGEARYNGYEKIHYSISLDELKYKLMLEGKYKNFNDFKRFVLDPAMEEINLISDLQLDLEWKYEGKKVDSLIFTIESIHAGSWIARRRNFMLLLDNKNNEYVKSFLIGKD